MNTKVCTKCGIEKGLEFFKKVKRNKSGVGSECKSCESARAKIYYKENKEKIIIRQKIYYEENKEKISVREKRYYQENKEKVDARHKRYKEENKDTLDSWYKQYRIDNKEKISASSKKHYQENTESIRVRHKKYSEENKDKINAYSSQNRAKKLNASPKWLTKEQLSDITAYYRVAKKLEEVTGEKFHVDHIHPLQGKEVNGLHVPWNLQVLSATENLSKNNTTYDKNLVYSTKLTEFTRKTVGFSNVTGRLV